MPTGEKQTKEHTISKGDIGIVTTESTKMETKRQTIGPLVGGMTATASGKQVTDENTTKIKVWRRYQ